MIVVGDYPYLPNFSLVEPIQNKTFPKTVKQYVHRSGLNIFAFPNVMVLCKHFLYHFESTENSFIIAIAIVKNYTDYFLMDFFTRNTVYHHTLFEIKFICIPPDKENYKLLFDLLLAQKQNRCGLRKTTKPIHSEEQKIAEFHSDQKNNVPYSWQDWKELAKSHRLEQADIEFILFFRISHSKLTALYERFDGTLDTLISYRQELAKLCTNFSKIKYDLAATEKLSLKAGLELIKSISFALEASRWNPKWSKSYYRMKKASKVEFDLTYDENASDAMFNTLKQDSLFKLHNMLSLTLKTKNMKEEKLNEEIARILNDKSEDAINYRKQISEEMLNAARYYFQSESPNDCLTTYNLVLDAKFMNPDSPNCSIFLKEHVEFLHSKATERELLFKKVQEDKLLRELVLFDIGYNLITKLNKNPDQEIPIQSTRFQDM